MVWHRPTAVDRRLKMINILTAIAFLTINLEVLPIGEYQPLLLLAMGGYLALLKGSVGERQLLCALLAMTVTLISCNFAGVGFNADIFRIFIVCVFIVTGNFIFQLVTRQVVLYVVGAHMAVLAFGLIAPGIVKAFLLFFFKRGALYYDGYNSFFASEPSYAAINYFGVYIIYRLACEVNSWPKPSIVLQLMFIFPLLFTKALTGVGFSLILISIMLYEYRSKLLKYMAASLPILLILLAVLLTSVDVNHAVDLGTSGFGRVSSFVAFLSDLDPSKGLTLWSVVEPASSARFISNFAGMIEGLSMPFGKGEFYIDGPDVVPYPLWLAEMFQANLILVPGINAQTPLFNFICLTGWLSFVPILPITYYSYRGLQSVSNRATFALILSYIIIAMFWQSAFVAPIVWIILATLIARSYSYHVK